MKSHQEAALTGLASASIPARDRRATSLESAREIAPRPPRADEKLETPPEALREPEAAPIKTPRILRSDWTPPVNEALGPRLHALFQEGGLGESSPSVELPVHAMMEDAVQARATDIHCDPFRDGWRIRFRVDGQLHDAGRVPFGVGRRMMRYIRTVAGLDPVIGPIPQDASFLMDLGDRSIDLRLATVPCAGGEKLALRFMDPQRFQHRVENLGLNHEDLERFRTWLRAVSGLFLVTGPSGSGKTTTLYALIHELELSSQSVVTIEDPVEYPIDGVSQIQVNAAHGLTFAAGLKAMLRLDPDHLVVGEMRDPESARIAIEASASGHCVMSTVHCPDAAGVVTLLRNWGLHDYQIASALQMVVNQRLVRRLCRSCRRKRAVTSAERSWLESLQQPLLKEVWEPVGCEACKRTGYHGRTGVFEVWQEDESDYALILAHTDEHTLRRHLRARGLKTVLEDGIAKVQDGTTSLSELQNV